MIKLNQLLKMKEAIIIWRLPLHKERGITLREEYDQQLLEDLLKCIKILNIRWIQVLCNQNSHNCIQEVASKLGQSRKRIILNYKMDAFLTLSKPQIDNQILDLDKYNLVKVIKATVHFKFLIVSMLLGK